MDVIVNGEDSANNDTVLNETLFMRHDDDVCGGGRHGDTGTGTSTGNSTCACARTAMELGDAMYRCSLGKLIAAVDFVVELAGMCIFKSNEENISDM